jgi:hypothetical protein
MSFVLRMSIDTWAIRINHSMLIDHLLAALAASRGDQIYRLPGYMLVSSLFSDLQCLMRHEDPYHRTAEQSEVGHLVIIAMIMSRICKPPASQQLMHYAHLSIRYFRQCEARHGTIELHV